jgi:Family of unknown function (DUF5678)
MGCRHSSLLPVYSVPGVPEVSMTPASLIRLHTLESAPLDSWIAISADESRIVAVGKDYREVSDLADAAGEDDVTILKTPPEWASLSV